ncbi:MAG: membrane dipeptidase [Chloroflexaceae bacterium]
MDLARVGFGPDFDRSTMPAAIGDAVGTPRFIVELRAQGYDDATLECPAYRHWLRVVHLRWG